jgi:hypothetical protein
MSIGSQAIQAFMEMRKWTSRPGSQLKAERTIAHLLSCQNFYVEIPYCLVFQCSKKPTARRGTRKSPQFNHMNQIDPKILQRSFVKLTADFPKRLTGLYMALHTGHAPINQYLHRIGKAASPKCLHCGNIDESVFHYLTICSHYQHECYLVAHALGCRAMSISFLLSDPDAMPHLVQYVNATGRLRSTFGEVPLPCKPADR